MLSDSPIVGLFGSAQFWLLAGTSISAILPWLRLRRVPVTIVTPSSHVALAEFDYGVTPFAGSSTAVSRSPLMEWHSFANVLLRPVPDFGSPSRAPATGPAG
jgi:hypothetical protein